MQTLRLVVLDSGPVGFRNFAGSGRLSRKTCQSPAPERRRFFPFRDHEVSHRVSRRTTLADHRRYALRMAAVTVTDDPEPLGYDAGQPDVLRVHGEPRL